MGGINWGWLTNPSKAQVVISPGLRDQSDLMADNLIPIVGKKYTGFDGLRSTVT